MLYVLLPAPWLREADKSVRPLQVQDDLDRVHQLNAEGYNVYFYPNFPSIVHDTGKFIQGHEIDTFEWVFVDFDLKSGTYASKDEFIHRLSSFSLLPTRIVDSGGGVHAYWRVSDLSAESYLRLQRRLARLLNTDMAVVQIKQLMRLPGTYNTKKKDEPRICEELYYENTTNYTCEQLDHALPAIGLDDEEYCKSHFEKTYNLETQLQKVDDKLPLKFAHLMKSNPEVKEIWAGNVEDRSAADYRLGHIMYANDFTKDEAASVLVNSAKALARAPIHRISYAMNIIDKIWTFEAASPDAQGLSSSVLEILQRSEGHLEGTPFRCYKYVDDTEVGFRLGHVMGLVAGSGVGKTAMALNLFMGFVESNPDYVHFFCPLEQSDTEIASRWKRMCGENTKLHSKVQILSNYDSKGQFRDLSLDDIKTHILEFQEKTGKQVGCVVIDHIGVLCNNNKLGQDEGVKQISKAMKGFAVETNTFLIMQSQTSREKAGIGDLELNKDAAFGTSVFENFCDYLVVLWQPLKRMYAEGAPTVMAYKFCKIRHKRQGVDNILEDVPYTLYFDPNTERVRELTQAESSGIPFWVGRATNKRKQDRKTDLVIYTTIRQEPNGTTNQDSSNTRTAS